MPKAAVSTQAVAASAAANAKARRKTVRSQEENQERAYIAASRRTDRSLEASVLSARMASEIHKTRTGKGFRLSEEIVLREEMYEEEEYDLLRSYRLLGAHMQTSSASMDKKLHNFVSCKVTITSLLAQNNDDWRENEINKLFEQSFGKIMSTTSRQRPQPQQPHPDLLEQHLAISQSSQIPAQSVASPNPQRHTCGKSMSGIQTQFHGCESTPQRHSSETPQSMSFALFNNCVQPDSPIDLSPSQHSAFTSYVPPNVLLMIEQGPVDSEMSAYFQEWTMGNSMNTGQAAQQASKLDAYSPALSHIDLHTDLMPVEMPILPVDDSWQSFIDDAICGPD